jgi:O-methyltransferase involved in polyketide biosynthesis
MSNSNSCPTLFIAECVLIYLKPEEGDQLLKLCANYSSICMCVTYEQIRPYDKFGLMMIANLQVRKPILYIHVLFVT